MAGDQVTVDVDRMREGASDMLKAKKLMMEAKESMVNDLGKQLESWDSDGMGADPKRAYEEVLRTWDQSMTDMETIARGMSSALGDITDNYQANEKSIEGQW